MGQKDIVEKNLEDFNDVFADIVNVLVFQGKRAVKPRELRQTKVRSQYKAADNQLHEEERDNAKYWSKGRIHIALFGLENQTESDPDMPFRVIGYDGAAYRSQLMDKNSKERFPVLSIVLYFGESHWKGPKTICEMIQIPDGLQKHVNDYRIHVFEIAYLEEQQIKLFTSDFRIVADYFVQRRKNKAYTPSKKKIKHIDAILKFFSVMTGDQRFSDIREAMEKGGGQSMCEILDQIENRGIKKGIQIGKDSMRAENDALRAENKAVMAEKEAVMAEKEAVMAENARLRVLLNKHHIVIA